MTTPPLGASFTIPLDALLVEYAAAQDYSLELVDGLDDAQIAWRPNENSSAIGWHLGHQAAVNHYLVRNLTAAEVTFDGDFDRVFDSATPEPDRGTLPPLDAIISYRQAIARSTVRVINRIADGDVGAPDQLQLIAQGMVIAIINHEYQHAKWIDEVSATMSERPTPVPNSNRLHQVDGYWMVRLT